MSKLTVSSLFSALGVLIFKGILFTMFLAYSMRREDLKWNRSPSLPMQKFGSGSIQRKSSDRASNYGLGLRSPGSSKVPGAAVYKARPMPPIPRSEKQPLTEVTKTPQFTSEEPRVTSHEPRAMSMQHPPSSIHESQNSQTLHTVETARDGDKKLRGKMRQVNSLNFVSRPLFLSLSLFLAFSFSSFSSPPMYA